MNDNYFAILNAINVNDKVEKKNGLSYLSWAWAWAEVKKLHPTAFYTIYENADGWNYHTDGRTCWVKTGVTVADIEHIEYLPVMDHRNRSIPLESVTSFDVNKTIQRSLTKALARHGLGLYIYAGEDLPENADPAADDKVKTLVDSGVQDLDLPDSVVRKDDLFCEDCGAPFLPCEVGGKKLSSWDCYKNAEKIRGRPICAKCHAKARLAGTTK